MSEFKWPKQTGGGSGGGTWGSITGTLSDQTDLQNALNAKQDNLPSQTGNSGKVLGTDGTDLSWVTPSGGVAITSNVIPVGTGTTVVDSGLSIVAGSGGSVNTSLLRPTSGRELRLGPASATPSSGTNLAFGDSSVTIGVSGGSFNSFSVYDTYTYTGGGITAGSFTTSNKVQAGSLQVTGSSPAAGKVLTSDASGNATWQTPAGGSPSIPANEVVFGTGTGVTSSSKLTIDATTSATGVQIGSKDVSSGKGTDITIKAGNTSVSGQNGGDINIYGGNPGSGGTSGKLNIYTSAQINNTLTVNSSITTYGGFTASGTNTIDSLLVMNGPIVTNDQTVSALALSWSHATQYKAISANSTFTWTAPTSGSRTTTVILKNTSASDVTVAFPAGIVKRADFTLTVKAGKINTYTFTYSAAYNKVVGAVVSEMSE